MPVIRRKEWCLDRQFLELDGLIIIPLWKAIAVDESWCTCHSLPTPPGVLCFGHCKIPRSWAGAQRAPNSNPVT